MTPGGVTLPGALEEAAEVGLPHRLEKTATAIAPGIGIVIGTGIVIATVIVAVIVTGTAIETETEVEIATAIVLPRRNGGAT